MERLNGEIRFWLAQSLAWRSLKGETVTEEALIRPLLARLQRKLASVATFSRRRREKAKTSDIIALSRARMGEDAQQVRSFCKTAGVRAFASSLTDQA